ncbi:MAG: acetolactate synthase [Candidatus Rokuibacteriota bacterium]|nr:MAG: acetolactate synthase [Candidatus Rokubacteria bacterium]
MGSITGSELLAKSLKAQGMDTLFYLMGGPMLETESACIKLGVRAIDSRHEQGASMMAHAYSRLTRRPGVCMASSGPGTINMATGVANAFVDAAPLIAVGGTSPRIFFGMDAFQEVDQLSLYKPITKWATRILDAKRIPDVVATAFRQATSGRPGPVFLDLPGDVLGEVVEESAVPMPAHWRPAPRAHGDPAAITEAIALLSRAERPLLIAGSGVWWSDAGAALQSFVETAGIPFYTTPLSRGAIPEDHGLAFLFARARAFAEADVILNVGTRFNYVIQFGRPPRWAADVKVIQVDVDPTELGHNRPADVPIFGDARAVLQQLTAEAKGKLDKGRYRTWVDRLKSIDAEKGLESEKAMSDDKVPIHPLRLCKEVRDFLRRDAILVVDGQEILNYGRQSIPTFTAGHRLNSGPFGCMGVGLPFGIGAKVACPDTQVVVLHGDGSYGINGTEIDTAVRHKIPVLVVISNNGGWTADPKQDKPGRNLGYTRYDKVAIDYGAHGEFVEKPHEIRAALERAYASRKPAVVNVVTDYTARATTVRFSAYST